MAYLHSYVWIGAARSFNQALRLDQNLAMAHVGLFRVFINSATLLLKYAKRAGFSQHFRNKPDQRK